MLGLITRLLDATSMLIGILHEVEIILKDDNELIEEIDDLKDMIQSFIYSLGENDKAAPHVEAYNEK